MSTKKSRPEAKPSVVRDMINKRIESLGITRYQFAHNGHVDAAASTVYRFLNGEVESSSGNLDEMFLSLGLKIKNSKRPAWAQKARKERTKRMKQLGRDPTKSVQTVSVTKA